MAPTSAALNATPPAASAAFSGAEASSRATPSDGHPHARPTGRDREIFLQRLEGRNAGARAARGRDQLERGFLFRRKRRIVRTRRDPQFLRPQLRPFGTGQRLEMFPDELIETLARCSSRRPRFAGDLLVDARCDVRRMIALPGTCYVDTYRVPSTLASNRCVDDERGRDRRYPWTDDAADELTEADRDARRAQDGWR